MLNDRLPLLEFDSEPGWVCPADAVSGAIPEAIVLSFFAEVIEARRVADCAEVVHELTWEGLVFPVYRVWFNGRPVGVVHPGVGGPLAAGIFEELVALGGRNFVVCGSAGSLTGLALGHIIVPDGAVRDEGTSFHYAAASSVIDADEESQEVAISVLRSHGLDFSQGLTWTTDAPFRETRSRIKRRRDEGCLTVEMEAASLIAVAAFRGVRLAVCLYAGDDLSGTTWQPRGWRSAPVREVLFNIGLEVVVNLCALDGRTGVDAAAQQA